MSLSTPAAQQAHDAKIAEVGFQRAKALSRVEQMLRDRDSESSYRRSFYDAGKHAEAQAQVDRFAAERHALVERYTGWPRYFHVTNANGHVHTSMSCSSCFHDTQFAWRTDLSGLTVEQVVEREAYNACTVCMPIAPAEQKAARARYNAEQRDAKTAERDAKKAEKAAKALVRAQKHVAKVITNLCKMTGETDLQEALTVMRRDFSLYGHDGRKSVYDATFDMPSQVGDTLYFLAEDQAGQGARSHHKPNDALRQALTEAGIL
jgi:hypothetical protein